MTSQALTFKLQKTPLNYDENMAPVPQVLFKPKSKSKQHAKQHSNIEQLKQEIKYLEMDNSKHHQFPNYRHH